MSPMLAILVYLAAIGAPIALLYRFGTQSWYGIAFHSPLLLVSALCRSLLAFRDQPPT